MEGKLNYKCHCSSCHQSNTSSSAPQQINTIVDELCDTNKRYEHRVNTSDLYQTLNLPERFERTYIFRGYGHQFKEKHPQHPAYQTTSSNYGWMPPNMHTVTQRYFPKSSEFTSLLAQCGMYRDYSLNTGMDKS